MEESQLNSKPRTRLSWSDIMVNGESGVSDAIRGPGPPTYSDKHWMLKWVGILACWAVVAAFFSTRLLIQNPYRVAPLSWWRVIVWELYFCVIWVDRKSV